MRRNIPAPLEAFEGWLLRQVAQAVEAGDVSASLTEERHAAVIQHITEIAQIPSEQEAGALESIEAHPPRFPRLHFVCSFLPALCPRGHPARRRHQGGTGLGWRHCVRDHQRGHQAPLPPPWHRRA